MISLAQALRLQPFMTLVAVSLLGCEKKPESSGTAGSAEPAAAAAAPSAAPEKTAAPSAGGAPKIGDSCEGIGATEGKLACQDNKIIFCSSYSSYKWTMQRECGDGTKCVAENNAASCK